MRPQILVIDKGTPYFDVLSGDVCRTVRKMNVRVNVVGTPRQPFVLYVKDNSVIDKLPEVFGDTISGVTINPFAGCHAWEFSQVRLIGVVMWGSNTQGWKITSPHWAKENPLFT